METSVAAVVRFVRDYVQAGGLPGLAVLAVPLTNEAAISRPPPSARCKAKRGALQRQARTLASLAAARGETGWLRRGRSATAAAPNSRSDVAAFCLQLLGYRVRGRAARRR